MGVLNRCYPVNLIWKSTVFWDITPRSQLKVNRRFGATFRLYLQGRRIGRALLAACFMMVSCLAYSLVLKMEAIYPSETSDDFQRTTWRYIPDDINFHNHHWKNLRSMELDFASHLTSYETLVRLFDERTEISLRSVNLSEHSSIIYAEYLILAEIPGVARVDHRTKCVSLVAISLSQNFETRNL
jgi:hypothetical protein